MCLQNLGLLLNTGTNALIYYSSRASRVFIANAGVIATVSITGYLFPEKLFGIVASAGAVTLGTWAIQKVEEKQNRYIADAMEKLITIVPTSVVRGYVSLEVQLKRPQQLVSREFANRRELSWVNENFITQTISPLLEEFIFRFGIQECCTYVLKKLGIPDVISAALAGTVSAVLFAGAHTPDPAQPQYRQVLTAGIGFAVMMYAHGFPGAVVSHAFYNSRLEF